MRSPANFQYEIKYRGDQVIIVTAVVRSQQDAEWLTRALAAMASVLPDVPSPPLPPPSRKITPTPEPMQYVWFP